MEIAVLNDRQIQQKLDRITYQITEDCFQEEHLYIIGIHGNGYKIATLLSEKLKELNLQKIHLVELFIDKKDPFHKEISLDTAIEDLDNNGIILVDDVLNSGKTMQYALTKILERPTKFIKTVALIDRKHRNFPIRCDYVGLTLSTTLQEHVEVKIDKEMKAYLI